MWAARQARVFYVAYLVQLEFELGPVLIYLQAVVQIFVYLCKFLEGKSDHCLKVSQHWSLLWTSVTFFTGSGLKLELA